MESSKQYNSVPGTLVMLARRMN